MNDYVWLVSEVDVDEPIPKIKCFKERNFATFLFDN